MYRFLLLLFLVASGCTPKVEPIPLSIMRFDHDVWTLKDSVSPTALETIRLRYGAFGALYFEEMVHLGSQTDSLFPERIRLFLDHPVVDGAFSQTRALYSDLASEERAFGEAFARYTSFFPDEPLPEFYACVTGFNHSVVTAEGIVAIGLDKYLGSEEPYYGRLGLAEYQRRVMRREYLVPDVMRAIGYARFAKNDSSENLISDMIFEGRNLYFVKQLLPQFPDTLLFGFTGAQLDWCHAAKSDIWRMLIEQELLFSADRMTRIKLIQPAPFTSYFSTESPGRAAVWLGYEIVRAYMKQNPELSIPHLMAERNYQNILNGSRFKP